MTIHYKCEHCGAGLKIKDELAGTQGACPKCKESFTVPEAPSESAEEQDPRPRSEQPAEAEPEARDGDGGAVEQADDKAAAHDKLKSWLEGDAAESEEDSSERIPVPVGAPPEPEGESGEAESDGAAARAKALMGAFREMKRASSRERKSGKASKAAPEPETATGEPGFDYAGLGGYLLTRVAPALGAVVGAFLVTYWIALAMYGPKLKLPPLARVSGTVTLDGEPLAGAMVTFHPLRSADTDVEASSSVGTTDAQGRYSLNYREGVAGAAIGRHMVEIRATDEHGGERLPRRYFDVGSATHQLREEVQAGTNTIDFVLTSDP